MDGPLWQIRKSHAGIGVQKFMALADFIRHEHNLHAIAAEHACRNRRLVRQFMIWFFCIRIPFAVYHVVGELDETFGRGVSQPDSNVRS